MLLGWNLLTMYCRILRFYHQNGLFKEICCISCSLCQGRHARVMFCRKLDGGNCWHYMLAPSLRSFGKSGLQGASFSLGPKRWPKLGTKDSVLRCQESQIHIYIYIYITMLSKLLPQLAWDHGRSQLILSYTFIYFLECSTAGSFSHLGMFPYYVCQMRSSLSCESQRTMTLPLTRPKSC